MAASTHSPDALEQMLGEERRTADAFCVLLEEERSALIAGELDRIESLAQDKLALGVRLKQHADQRQSLIAAAGRNLDASDALAHSPRHAAIWSALKARLAHAQEQNRINGLLIHSRLSAVSSALAALHGAADHPGLYARDGTHATPASAGAARWSA